MLICGGLRCELLLCLLAPCHSLLQHLSVKLTIPRNRPHQLTATIIIVIMTQLHISMQTQLIHFPLSNYFE